MSMHAEWDTATECAVNALTADAAAEYLQPDDGVAAPFVLALGGAGGGVLAVEGTREDLVKFAARIAAAVDAL